MALRWNLQDVDNFSELLDDDRKRLPAFIEAAIWKTITVGINEITEDNWEKFWLRCQMVSFVDGESILPNEDIREEENINRRSLTKGEVKRLIGLKTNAATKTDKEFRSIVMDNLRKNAKSKGERVCNKLKEYENVFSEGEV